MDASGEPGNASSPTSTDLHTVGGSCDSIAMGSTAKLNGTSSGNRRVESGGDSPYADVYSLDGDSSSASWHRSKSRFTPWSRVHQRMLAAVFLVGILFAVAVGEASQPASPVPPPPAAPVPPPPSADQPTAASPNSPAEAGGDESGGAMPFIIGGAVVMMVLGTIITMYLLYARYGPRTTTPTGDLNPAIPDKTGGLDPSWWTYFGVPIGDLSSKEHGVSGKVYAATQQVISIKDFSYDGSGSSVVFMVGTTDSPDENGEVVNDITKRAPAARRSGPQARQAANLRKYTSERVVLKLPKPIKEYKYFAVYSKDEKKSYGEVKIENFKPPDKQVMGQFENTDHDIRADSSTLLDAKRIEIKGFHIDDQAPAVLFVVGKGPRLEENAHKVIDEYLNDLHGKDFLISLPENETWDQFEWFSAWCFNVHSDLGSFNLPAPGALTVPVYFSDSATQQARQRGRAVERRVRSAKMSLANTYGYGANTTAKPTVLACTVGKSGATRSMIPSDGLCDVMFYTDVEFDSDSGAILPTNGGGPAFNVLKRTAKKYTRTTFGTSMSTGSITDTMRDNMTYLITSMNQLFNSQFIHFGMLNVDNIKNYATLKGRDLKYLKVVADFLKTKKSNRHYHCALGISLRDGSKGDKILEVAKKAPEDFPGLTMVVVKLHTEDIGSSGDLWPVGPNPDGAVMTDHNALSLASIKNEVKKELMDVARHGRYAMLSFALYARTYRMKPTWSNASVREMSESSRNMEYLRVCNRKAEKERSDAGTMYAADLHRRFLALFDSPQTLKSKTWARLRVMPKRFTGMAVYNVEMDDYTGTCGQGRFPLLKAIKEALKAKS